jgi:hypothetical protein
MSHTEMNPFSIADEWLMRRYQNAADSAYTLWGLSPYRIAAQCAGVAALLNIAFEGYRIIEVGVSARLVSLFFALLSLLWTAMCFWEAMRMHDAWLKGRKDISIIVLTLPRALRAFLFIMGVLQTLACIIGLFIAPNETSMTARVAMLAGIDLATASTVYFLACSFPIDKGRKQHSLTPAREAA